MHFGQVPRTAPTRAFAPPAARIAISLRNHYQYAPERLFTLRLASPATESPLSRDDHVQLDGVVTNVFAGGQFEVKTDAGPIVRAQLSGRMRKNRIRVILGDRVTVGLSPYDLTHGMITYRLK